MFLNVEDVVMFCYLRALFMFSPVWMRQSQEQKEPADNR